MKAGHGGSLCRGGGAGRGFERNTLFWTFSFFFLFWIKVINTKYFFLEFQNVLFVEILPGDDSFGH